MCPTPKIGRCGDAVKETGELWIPGFGEVPSRLPDQVGKTACCCSCDKLQQALRTDSCKKELFLNSG